MTPTLAALLYLLTFPAAALVWVAHRCGFGGVW